MGMFRNKNGMVTGLVLAVVLALGVAGASLVTAKGSGEYDKVSSVKDLATARGVVADWAQTKDGRDWFISGEWTLNCHGPCVNAKPKNIDFDLAFTMYRAGAGTDGNGPDGSKAGDSSHGHIFRDFSASSAVVSEDDPDIGFTTLTIKGEITGSGEIAPHTPITIKLVKHPEGQSKSSGHFTFYFQLFNPDPNDPDQRNAFATEAGSVVVESKGNRSYDD